MSAQDPACPRDRNGSARPGEGLQQAVKGMSDGDLRALAGAVLAELKARAPVSGNPGFAHERLLSDLQRRLADAHDYVQSGRRGGSAPPPARPSRRGSGALSGETKAKVLIGLEAELLPPETAAAEDAHPAKPAPLTPARGGPAARDAGARAPVGSPVTSASLEEEIRQALHRGVRKRSLPPPAALPEDRRP